jgi:hypothetical protein
MKNRIVFFAIGAGLMWASWLAGKEDFASRNWKPVQGQVVFSKAVKRAGGWEPVVRYQYTVDGKTHESGNDRPDGGWAALEGGGADLVLVEYPRGRKVTVFYNPSNPELAALEVGPGMRDVAFALIGLIFIAIAIFVKGSGSPATPQTTSAAAGSNS